MGRVFKESDFKPRKRRTFKESDFKPRKGEKRTFTEDDFVSSPESPPMLSIPGIFKKGVLGTEEQKGFSAANIAEELGQQAGPILGGMVGTSGGIPGIAAGAAAGKAIQNSIQAGAGRDITPLQAVSEPLIEGAVQATGEKVMSMALSTRAAKTLGRKLAERLGMFEAGATRVSPKAATAAIAETDKLANAPSHAQVSQAYDDFFTKATQGEGIMGLISREGQPVMGRRELISRADDPFETVSRSMGDMKSAWQKYRSGELTLQEAISASQAARKIRDMKSRGNELALEIADTADNLKDIFDDFIDKKVPANLRGEWKRVREMAFWRNVADEFSSVSPTNLSGRPDRLRGMGGVVGGAVVGGASGDVISGMGTMAGIAALQSPLLHGFAIRGAFRGAQAGKRAAMSGLRPGAANAAASLEENFQKRSLLDSAGEPR